MEMKFDPMTGEPIKSENEASASEVRFDPMTGEPIKSENETNGPAASEPEVRFDPMTGKPIVETAQPEMNFDPMTGKPIGAAPQPEVNFDPMTGKPYAAKKKSPAKWIVAAAAAVAAVVVVVAVGVGSGAFLGKNGKVVQAVVNTCTDQSEFSQNFYQMYELVGEKSFTISGEASIAGQGGEVVLRSKGADKQVSGSVNISGMPSIEAIAELGAEEVKAQIPALSDDVYIYNYREEKSSFLVNNVGEEDIMMIDAMLKMLYDEELYADSGKEILNIFKDVYMDLEFESVSKEEFEIDDKDRNCKGYMTTLTSDTALDLIDAFEEYYDKKYDEMEDTIDTDTFEMMLLDITGVSSVNDAFRMLRSSVRSIPDVDVTVYIYKKELACVQVETGAYETQLIFHGGNTRTENIELTVNNATILEVAGTKKGSVEEREILFNNMTVGSLEYDEKSGEYEIQVMYGLSSVSAEGTLEAGRNEAKFTVDRIVAPELSVGVSVEFMIEKGADFEKIEGDEFDLGNASESDYMELMEEIYELSYSSSDMGYF